MRLLAPLVLAIAAATPATAGAAVHARLTPELTAGGGWGSAIYIGDEAGAGWQTHLTPGVGFDLSTGPVVKLLSAYRFTWSRYAHDRSSLFHDAEATVRVRLGRDVDLELAGAFDSIDFEDATGTLAGDATTPPSVRSTDVDAGPVLRWRATDRTTAEAALAAGVRESDLGDGSEVEEDYQRATLGLTHRFSPWVQASLRYRHVRNRSDDSLWSYDGDGGQLSLGWATWGDLVVQGYAGIQWNRFDRRTDRYIWLGAGATLPVARGTTAEIAWSYGDNAVVADETGGGWSGLEGDRHLLWSGVRVELPWWL